MDFYPLDITLISAEGLKNVNIFTKMDVYVVVSIDGNPSTAHRSHADKDAGSNPRWNHHIRFDLDDYTIKNRSLLFLLKSDRALGDRDIGQVSVPISELFQKSTVVPKDDAVADDAVPKIKHEERLVDYKVHTPSGKIKGSLKFSYKFGEKYIREVGAPPPPAIPAMAGKGYNEPITAYPAGSSGSYQPHVVPGMVYGGAPVGYPPPGYGHTPQHGYGGYPPPQQAYGGGYAAYPPAGYPPQHMGYQQAPPQYVQQPHRMGRGGGGGSKLGLGLGAGLLGGLLVGDMIGDMGEMASYDAGYDAGFDDGGDF